MQIVTDFLVNFIIIGIVLAFFMITGGWFSD